MLGLFEILMNHHHNKSFEYISLFSTYIRMGPCMRQDLSEHVLQ